MARQHIGFYFDFLLLFGAFSKPAEVVWVNLFALCPSSLMNASSASPA
ncbi:hypothetical protein [Bradyrhizobium sp. AUGA SZCCT0283]|jgi:hypothetical protein|nr:hypothetical protein [Bradyrhizobium sp. AUGA SZCCT0283]